MCVYVRMIWVVMFMDKRYSGYIFGVCFKRKRNSWVRDKIVEELG